MTMKKVFGAGAVMCVAMLSHNAYADGMCGVNLFNPMILTEADFVDREGVYIGGWNGYLDLYLSNYSFGFLAGKSYKVSYRLKCDVNGGMGNQFLGLKLSDNTVIGPNSNVCDGQGGADVLVEYTVPAGATVVGMTVGTLSGASAFDGEVSISNVMVVDAEQDTSSFIAYEPCIKIATTKMNEVRATAVNERLDDVRDTINSLITQMQNNAIGVDALAVEKQTRPDATCPAGKNCLLVTDPNGAENWYVITDCEEIEFFQGLREALFGGHIMGNFANHGAKSATHEYGSCAVGGAYANVTQICGIDSSNPGAWVLPLTTSDPDYSDYNNALIYGKARCVADVGFDNVSDWSVVSLSASQSTAVANGNVCIHNITGYRTSTGQDVALSAEKSNVWVVKKYQANAANNETAADVCIRECYNESWPESYFPSYSQVWNLYDVMGNSCRL